jgi:hypothetical protein
MFPVRDEDNDTRRKRLAKIKRGPGVFVYNGEAIDTEWVPTVLMTDARQPSFDSTGLPVMDRSGRQQFEPAGIPVRKADGLPALGGPPDMRVSKLEVFTFRGVSYTAGEEFKVSDPSLALKLRCLMCFDEVEPKKRGRPSKDKDE